MKTFPFGARAGAAGLALLLALAACEPQRTTNTPPPAVEPIRAATSDPSVPAAGSVVSPPTAPTAQDAGQGRAEGRMTRAQESSAMPMPGQANDHSTSRAASAPPRSASAP